MARFTDRLDAARQLAARLQRHRPEHPVVVGIPRGAVPMAAHLARALDGDLDVVLVHKVGHPENPEFAVAAVDEEGHLVGGEGHWVTPEELGPLAEHEVQRLRERRRAWSGERPPVDVHDRVVIVVDDGLATGLTMVAALRSLRARGARHLVVAAPVASESAARLVADEADELCILSVPPGFGAVGYYFDDFAQVTDEDVAEALRGAVPVA